VIHSVGDLDITDAGDANVPVDIWIHELEAECADELPWTKRVGDAVHCKFCLAANNYMPRKASCEGELAYLVFADTREELVELIKEHIIPLYENALSILNEMCNGSKSYLYYWKRH